MPSSFPAAVDTLPTNNTDSTASAGTHPALHNDANAAIMATQAAVRPFDHVQATPAATWTIDHGLGRPVSAVTVIDNSGVEVIGGLEFPTSDRVLVKFTTPVSGRARVS